MKKIFNLINSEIDIPKLKRIVFYTFVFGLIAHGYCMFNANFSHDSLSYMLGMNSEFYISNGRITRIVYQFVKGKLSLPLINIMLSILFISLSNYFILDVIGIKSKLYEIICCGILVTNYSISLLYATYIHDSDAYAFALLCSSLGAWILFKHDGLGWLLSLFLFVFSLGIYQAYIEVAIFIVVVNTIFKVFENRNIKQALISLIKKLTIIGISMLLYFALYKLLSNIFCVVESTYHSPSEFLNISLNNIYERFTVVKDSIYIWIFLPRTYNMSYGEVMNFCLIILFSIINIYLFVKKELDSTQVVTIVVLNIILILGTNVIQFISQTRHELTVYAYFLFYIYVFKLFENYSLFSSIEFQKIGKIALIFLCSFVLIDNMFFSNAIYIKKEMEQQSTLSLCTRILDRIEQIDDYVPGVTKVAFIGKMEDSKLSKERNGFEVAGIGLGNVYATVKKESMESYIINYLNYPINIVDIEQYDELSIKGEIEKMNVFPLKDSVKYINDILIVKLS